MKYDCKYQSGARSFEPDFGRVINATDGGFERGYAQGRTEGEAAANAEAAAANAAILSDCNAILPEKGVSTADSLEQVPQKIGEIKVEPIWISYMTSISGCFGNNANFPADTDLVIELPNFKGSLTETFQETPNIRSVTLIYRGETQQAWMHASFRWNYAVRKIDLSEFNITITNGYNTFMLAQALEEIIGELAFTPGVNPNTGDMFFGCYALKEIRFKKETIAYGIWFGSCDKLSDESIQSIIDGLADLTGATAQTMTLHTTVGAKLTEAQKENIAAKNWTLVY